MKIGVVINHAEDQGKVPSYSHLRDLAQTADDGGLDSIWIYDHLIFRFEREGEVQTSGIWEGWTTLCALAEATQRVQLGTVVLCNPFRNPALLAKMAHTLDEISGGRLILGLGAGWHKPEFDAFGYSFDNRVDRFEEALQIIHPLLRGEQVTFKGRHYQVEECLITPLGPRLEGIPVMIGASGPRMMRLTAQYAGQWNTAWYGRAADFAPAVEKMKSACAKTGRDPATLKITVGITSAFPDLGPSESRLEHPLTGTPEQLAQSFQEFEAAGADHLILTQSPETTEVIERIAEGVRLFKST